MEDPFDRSLPSPIEAVLELRASARGSVVRAAGMTPVQERSYVPTGLEEALVGAARDQDAPACIVITGSAGGGKSAILSRIVGLGGELFDGVLEDATHAEAPDQEQYERLVTFLGPLADGLPTYQGRPLLIAMNTGMVIRFFDQLRSHRGHGHGFTALETELYRKLRLPDRLSEYDLPGRVLVINLDLRSTAGGGDSLFTEMLSLLDPDAAGGIMDGAPRCGTCLVRDFCFVRTNAEIVSSPPVRQSLDNAAAEIAMSRGRPLQPRELWDLSVDVTTGGEVFPAGDPCDRIAEIAQSPDGVLTVWRRLACNGAFLDPAGRFGADLAALDPSYEADDDVHEIISGAGIDAAADAAALETRLGSPVGREAVSTAARALKAGAVVTAAAEYDRPAAGRALVRAAALVGDVSLAARDHDPFVAALDEYARPGDSDTDDGALDAMRKTVAAGLTRAFGVEAGVERFFFTRAYDPRRRHSVLVHADVDSEVELFRLEFPDPVREAIGDEAADLVGYRPYAVTFRLAGVELRIDLPLYRLLRDTVAGTRPSTADLERFYHLRRAAEALGRRAASDTERPLLISDRDSGRRYRLARRRDVRGNPILGVQEVPR